MISLKLQATNEKAQARLNKHGAWWFSDSNPTYVEGYESEGLLNYIRPVKDKNVGGHWIRCEQDPDYTILQKRVRNKGKSN